MHMEKDKIFTGNILTVYKHKNILQKNIPNTAEKLLTYKHIIPIFLYT